MKNQLISLLTVGGMALLLSACTGELKSNDNKLTVESSETSKAASESAYADVDAAYSAGYKKVGLPDRETIETRTPDGVYLLELEVVNKILDEAWISRKSKELIPLFGSETDTASMKIKTAKCSAGYMLDNSIKAEAVTPLNKEMIESADIVPLNTKTLSSLDEKMKEAVGITEKYNEQIGTILNDELTSVAYEAICYKSKDGIGYGVQIEKQYKNVPISPYSVQHPNDPMLSESSELYPLEGYCYFDSSLKTVMYHADNSYKVVKAYKEDNIISFKGACDLLENNLGDAAHYDFEKIVLMYDPRVDTTKDENFPNINCRPKWYFITYTEDFFRNSINCFTVDCIDGTIEVVL